MATPLSARITVAAGALGLVTVVGNQLASPAADQALQRTSVLGSLLAVGLMLVGLLWTQVVPEAPQRANLQGRQGLVLASTLQESLRRELAWGSQMLLTATPAAVVAVLWKGEMVLQRGLLPEQDPVPAAFSAGSICERCLVKQAAIHLVDLRHYPGRAEFEPLLADLPSVLVQPIGRNGLLVLGGWSARCFSTSDQAWVKGWALKLKDEWSASAQQPLALDPATAAVM